MAICTVNRFTDPGIPPAEWRYVWHVNGEAVTDVVNVIIPNRDMETVSGNGSVVSIEKRNGGQVFGPYGSPRLVTQSGFVQLLKIYQPLELDEVLTESIYRVEGRDPLGVLKEEYDCANLSEAKAAVERVKSRLCTGAEVKLIRTIDNCTLVSARIPPPQPAIGEDYDGKGNRSSERTTTILTPIALRNKLPG